MKQVELLPTQIKILEELPEAGMGWQLVDLVMQDGKKITNKVILNCSVLQIDKVIDPQDIKEIICK